MMETKQKANENVTNHIARWSSLTFVCSQKFTQQNGVFVPKLLQAWSLDCPNDSDF